MIMSRNLTQTHSFRTGMFLEHPKNERLQHTLLFKERRRIVFLIRSREGRKGQFEVGKTISLAVTFLFLFVILLLYYALTASMLAFKQVEVPVIGVMHSGNSILMQQITLSIHGKDQKMFVVEALAHYQNEKITSRDFEDGLKQLVSAEQPCFAFAQGEYEHPARARGGSARENYLLSWNDGQPRSSNPGYVPLGLAAYERAGVLEKMSFSFQGKKIYTESYLGRCIDES